MMKRLLLVGLLALTGCFPSPDPTTMAKLIADVQATTRQTCSIIPAANAIAQLIDIIIPAGVTATPFQAAQRICNEYNATTSAGGGAPSAGGDPNLVSFTVEGVPFEAVVVP